MRPSFLMRRHDFSGVDGSLPLLWPGTAGDQRQASACTRTRCHVPIRARHTCMCVLALQHPFSFRHANLLPWTPCMHSSAPLTQGPPRSFCLCTAQALSRRNAVPSRQERSPMPSGTGLLKRSRVWSYWMRVRQYGQTFHSAFSGRWQVGQTFLTWVLQTGQTTKSRSIGVPHFGQMP